MIDAALSARFAKLVTRIDPAWRLLDLGILSGGDAAHVVLLEVVKPDGSRERLVVRRHRPRDLANNPNIARDEFRLLALLRDDGVAAPRPVHCEPAGLFETPCLVVTHVDGAPAEDHPDPDALVDAMADYLARLHRIDGNRRDLAFLPRTAQWLDEMLADAPSAPDETLSEARIRHALAAAPPIVSRNRPALLHGDFWPGNVIWKDGAIAGAIDWEDCAVGDPIVDVANSRLELAWLAGPHYAERFADRYAAATAGAIDLEDLPRWDLWAALRPAGWVGGWEDYDAATVDRMKSRHRAFVDRALAALDRAQR